MMVSVIIPTTDREKAHLQRCIESVMNSTYKNIEIIPVNEGKERSVQRNIGIDRARGEWFLFLDSDQSVEPELIEECLFRAKHGLKKAFYIPEKITTGGFFGYLRNWERQFYTGTEVDCVRFVSKDICPRFDETMHGPEDSDFDRRIRWVLKGKTTSKILHKDEVTVLGYFKKKAYYSKSMNKFAERNFKDKILDWKWRCFGVYFEDGKWKRVLLRPDLFLLICMMNFVRGVIYLWAKRY